MATTVEDLYREVLGREPDPEGLAFWKAGFGSEISPEERDSFVRSAQPEIQSRGITQSATPTLTPDQLQARAQKAYDDYSNVLRNGEVTADTIRQAYGEHDPAHVQRVLKIKSELDAQQAAGAKEYYSAGRISAENATWDMAFRLSEVGLSSVQDMGKRTDYNQLEQEYTQYYNKANGEDITNNWNRVSDGGGLRTNYNLHFTDDGMVMPYTSRESSSWVNFRDSTLKPIGGIVLAAYGVPYVAGALAGTTIGGVTLAKGSAALAAASSAAVSGGVSLLAGNSFEDSLKSALVSGLTAGASAGYADKIGQSLGFDAGSIASKAAGNAVVAAVKAGVTDENVLESMVTAALTTAMTAQNDFDATEREGSLAKPSFDDSELSTDFSVGADYTLGSNLKFPSLEGIRVDDMEFGDNYDLTAGTIPFETGLRDTLPNLTAMGGGQGITIRRDDGTILSGQDFTSGSLMNEDDEDLTAKSSTVGSTDLYQNNFETVEAEKLLGNTGNNNYNFKADYDLSSNLKFDGVGLKVDDVQDAGFNVGYEPVDYGIGNITGGGGLGLTTGSSPNLTAMGGGQGITVKRDDGTTLSGVNDAGLNLKDVKTIAKIGGVLMAGDAVIDKTIRPKTSLGAKREDPWRNAPIEGFRMAKFEDPTTGKFKYVPFVKNNALLPPPSGYKEIDYYAKGGFVTKRN